VTCSLPDPEHERQWSVNDFRPCIMVDQSARWPLMFIYGVLIGFIGKNIQNLWVAALNTNWVVIMSKSVAGQSPTHQSMKAAKTFFIDVYDHLPPRFHKIQDQKSLSLCWRLLSRWGRESVGLCFAYTVGQYVYYRLQWLIHILKPDLQDEKSLTLGWPWFCHRSFPIMQPFTLA